jgi:ubiquinone/menaquinone biosynthesis C-methylase UbiE
LQAAGLEPGQEVLEVGCGRGFFTVPAAKIVGKEGRVVVLDINPLAVAHVQKKIEAQHVTNVRTLLANAAQTDLPDQSFHLILLFGIGHPIGGLAAIWAEADRLLKPGGTLAVEGRLRPPEKLFRHVQRQGRITQYRKVA